MGPEIKELQSGARPDEAVRARLLEDVRQGANGAGSDRLKQLTNVEIEDFIGKESNDPKKFDQVKSAYEELIRRNDARYTDADHQKVMPKIAQLMDCLRLGIGIKPDGKGDYQLAPEKPLSEEYRYMYHQAITRTIELMDNPIAIRQNYIEFLSKNGKHADALKVAEQASDKAQLLMTPIKYGDKTTRMIDIMQQEKTRLIDDQALIGDANKRQKMMIAHEMMKGRTSEDGMAMSPVNINRLLTYLYLGTELQLGKNENGETIIAGVKFGMNTGFKPDLAMKAAERARDNFNYIARNDVTTKEFGDANPNATSLYGTGLNMFLDSNRNGKPDILEAASIDNLNAKIKEGSRASSYLVDAGVVVLSAAVLALSRNARAAGTVEKVLGKAGMAEKFVANPALAGQIARGAGIATAIGTSIPARHYGFKMLTGGDERWDSSAVHAIGSLMAAEVGMRVVGRASALADNGGVMSKPFQFANYDAKAASELFAKEGYKTTGQLRDMLFKRGFRNEAKAFESLAADTPVTSDAARKAIEQAELTYGRLSTVAKGVIKDQKIAAKEAAKAAKENGGAKLSDEEVKVPGSVEEMKIKGPSKIASLKNGIGDRFRLTPIDPAKAGAREIAKARTGSAVYGSFATAATYNTIVKTYDLHTESINPDTGNKYTIPEALLEAHLPSLSDEDKQLPMYLQAPLRALGGTPGETFAGMFFMKPGAIMNPVWRPMADLWGDTNRGVPYKVFKSMRMAPVEAWQSTPLSFRFWANRNAGLFNNTLLGPSSLLLENRLTPMLEAAGSNISVEEKKFVDPTAQYKEMLRRAKQPVQNDK